MNTGYNITDIFMGGGAAIALSLLIGSTVAANCGWIIAAFAGWRIKDEMAQMVGHHDKQGLLENRAPIGDVLGSAKFPDGGLIFGHLHLPYLNPDEGMANCGSWHSGYGMNNIYIEIDGETVHLRRFEG
jgi:hypothetical protein